MESVITSVVKEVVSAQQQNDENFLELEGKKKKFEAEQKKEEREFQLRLMSMLFGNPACCSYCPGFIQFLPTISWLPIVTRVACVLT